MEPLPVVGENEPYRCRWASVYNIRCSYDNPLVSWNQRYGPNLRVCLAQSSTSKTSLFPTIPVEGNAHFLRDEPTVAPSHLFQLRKQLGAQENFRG